MSHGLPTNELNKRRGADLSACRGVFQEGPVADLTTTGDGLISWLYGKKKNCQINSERLHTHTHARLPMGREESIGFAYGKIFSGVNPGLYLPPLGMVPPPSF